MEKILVALDFSDVTLEVLDQAKELARALPAKLWLLHTSPPEPEFVGYRAGIAGRTKWTRGSLRT